MLWFYPCIYVINYNCYIQHCFWIFWSNLHDPCLFKIGQLDNLGKRFHLSFFDIQCPSNFLHLWLSQKKAKIILLWILLEAIMLVVGKFTVYSQIYLFVSRGGGRCATVHPIFSQMPIFISFLEKKKFWKSDKIWPIYRQMQFFFAYFKFL